MSFANHSITSVIVITTTPRWVIYDSYVAYETAKELAEEREMKKEAKDIKVIKKLT